MSSFESSEVGTCKLKLCRCATAESFLVYQLSVFILLNGRTAPSAMVKRPFGITSSGSTSKREPSPVQTGQAP